MPILRDVARLAGVHPSIASRVLNGDKSTSVKEETRQRVLEAARSLGYRPNAPARALRMKTTGNIALVIPDVSNPVYAEIIRGAEQRARQSGYFLLLASTEGTDPREREFLHALLEGRVDGLILANALLEPGVIDDLEKGGYPYVLVNRRTHGARRYVVADDKGGAAMAVHYLIGLGHRRIGHLAGPQAADTAVSRFEGYREALGQAGIPFDRTLVASGEYTTDAGRRGARQLLSLNDPPTAVFASNLRVAAGAMDVARQLGVRIPDDLSIIGIHDAELAALLTPALTTVRMPLEAMGREAVDMLIRLVNDERGPDQVVLTQNELVVRETVGPPGQGHARVLA